jgi:ABC-type multidrug transport system fused ATPase/permease subunit
LAITTYKGFLATLLLNLDEGRVLIEALPLSGGRLHAWRRSVGYVPQENFLFIAHRLSTVGRADQVVLLDDGKVVEKGTWEDLMKQPKSRIHALTQDQPNLLY